MSLFHFLQKKPEASPVLSAQCPPKELLPVHVGIIMDGNGRWAKRRDMPRRMGHRAGAEVFKTITRYASTIGIQYLTVYAFSTENWKRPSDEVNALIQLFMEYLREALRDFYNENIRVCFLGEIDAFPQELQELVKEITEASSDRTGMVLNICLNYGGRMELVHSVKEIVSLVQEGSLSPEEITEQTLTEHLYYGNQPDVDLVIRPSGECRTSNFMLWQSAYAEYVFMDTLWPDFTPEKLNEALQIYLSRNRRFGGVK